MPTHASPDKPAILASRGIYELACPRPITTDDMQYALKLAMPPGNAKQLVVIRLEWEVDGVQVASPAGEFGARVTAEVELLLIDGGTTHG